MGGGMRRPQRAGMHTRYAPLSCKSSCWDWERGRRGGAHRDKKDIGERGTWRSPAAGTVCAPPPSVIAVCHLHRSMDQRPSPGVRSVTGLCPPGVRSVRYTRPEAWLVQVSLLASDRVHLLQQCWGPPSPSSLGGTGSYDIDKCSLVAIASLSAGLWFARRSWRRTW